MPGPVSRTTAARALAVLATLGFIAVLLWLLPQPGYSTSRAVLFALLADAAILGTIGVLAERPLATGAGVAGLVLLGFWQAVLSVFVWPVVGALLVAAVLARADPEATSAP